MKFSYDELFDLTKADGGRFCTASTEESYAFCKRLALGHYENFPVGSILIPRHLQPHFFSIYAFSRIADDIADELHPDDHEQKFRALADFEYLLLNPSEARNNPVFRALHETIQRCELPNVPFRKLLTAFRMDGDFIQADSFTELENYCAHSANPVGELVLRLFGLYDDDRAPFSDAICTGLQCANFWQDFSRDLPVGRIFIPKQILRQFGLEGSSLLDLHSFEPSKPVGQQSVFNANKTSFYREEVLNLVKDAFFQCFGLLYERTKSYFTKGSQLLPTIPHKRLRAELALTLAGGERILEKTFALKHHILLHRPSLSKRDTMPLLRRSLSLFIQR